MFRNLCTVLIFLFAFFVLNGATTNTKGTKIQPKGGCATTTSAKKAKLEVKCIPEEKRTTGQKAWCKFLSDRSRTCKLDVDCLRVKNVRTEEENKRLEEENIKQAVCAHFSYKHFARSNTFLLQEPKEGSLQIIKIKKGDEIDVMKRIEDNQSWMLVATKNCDQGYVNETFVVRKDDVGPAKKSILKPGEIIKLTSPKWSKPNKLIIVPSSGFFDIEGEVHKSVDQITLNDEDLIIESYGAFSETLLIKKEDLDIRIIAYKDGEQLDKLTFIVKTSN